MPKLLYRDTPKPSFRNVVDDVRQFVLRTHIVRDLMEKIASKKAHRQTGPMNLSAEAWAGFTLWAFYVKWAWVGLGDSVTARAVTHSGGSRFWVIEAKTDLYTLVEPFLPMDCLDADRRFELLGIGPGDAEEWGRSIAGEMRNSEGRDFAARVVKYARNPRCQAEFERRLAAMDSRLATLIVSDWGGHLPGTGFDAKIRPAEETILEAMRLLKTFNRASGLTQAVIVRKAFSAEAEPNSYKHNFANLRHAKFTESARGPSGRCWLTEIGQQRSNPKS